VLKHQPLIATVLGNERDTRLLSRDRGTKANDFAIDTQRSPGGTVHAGDHASELGAPAAHQPGETDDLSGPDREAD